MSDNIYFCRKCSMESVLMEGAAQVCPFCGWREDVSQASGKSFLKTLNSEQRVAAEYNGKKEAVLLLAGAGCGKTRTMIGRALYLLQVKHVKPERIAMLTFTRRAAKEIQERLSKEMPGSEKLVFVGTFHRMCLNLIHSYGNVFPSLRNVKIMDSSDQEIIVRRFRNEYIKNSGGLATKKKGTITERGVLSVFTYINNRRMSIVDYCDKECNDPLIIDFMIRMYENYTAYKKFNGYLDFDDILTTVTVALEKNPDFRKMVQKTLDYILVDEMQDTSPVQWDMLKALYQPVKLFCVGDDAQSIYSFRGADFESVHRFCEILPNSISMKLTENYRSTQQILDVANTLIAASPLDYDRRLNANHGEGLVKPKIMYFISPEQEATSLVRLISRKLYSGTPPKEIMVLMRSTLNGRELEYALRKHGIKYRIVGGTGFLQAAHVKDIVAILEALAVPGSELSWLRFLELLPKIGMKSAEKLYAKIAGETDKYKILQIMAENLKPKNTIAAEFIGETFDLDHNSGEMLKQIMTFLDSQKIMEQQYDNWDERAKDLEILIDIASRYDSVTDFLEAFKLDPDGEAKENQDESDAITLITVHSAKGTEADVCIIPQVQPGNYPHYRSDESHIEEDRRILYVAMTRARKELYLTVTVKDNNVGNIFFDSFITKDIKALLERRHNL